METKGWDVFRVLPPEQDSSSEAMNKRCMSITVRILKVIAYVVSFCVVLGGAVISKSTFLFMTSQVSTYIQCITIENQQNPIYEVNCHFSRCPGRC